MVSTLALMVCVVLAFTFSEVVNCEEISDNRSYLAPYLNKKYKLATSDENFEEVMKALGVGLLKRTLGNLAKPVMELTEKDGEYTLSSESVFKNTYVKFRIGEEFEEVTPDDRTVKSIITQDKNKLIQVQKGEKVTVITREFAPEEVKVVVEVDGIISVRTYLPL